MKKDKVIVGYTQGTFDMFHVGHLNLIKKARERCDFLVVGVNTDELVMRYKKKDVIVPLKERMEIIDSITYVDKVVITDTLDKELMYKNLMFNKIFIGDDWKGSERWAETEVIMDGYGVEVDYLPYTKGTSSSILRQKLIDRR